MVVRIASLFPGEDEPRLETLGYYTRLYDQFGSIDGVLRYVNSIAGVPYFVEAEGVSVVPNGNQRMLWLKLNGVEEYEIEKREHKPDVIKTLRECIEDSRKKGIVSFSDLAALVSNPQRYIVH